MLYGMPHRRSLTSFLKPAPVFPGVARFAQKYPAVLDALLRTMLEMICKYHKTGGWLGGVGLVWFGWGWRPLMRAAGVLPRRNASGLHQVAPVAAVLGWGAWERAARTWPTLGSGWQGGWLHRSTVRLAMASRRPNLCACAPPAPTLAVIGEVDVEERERDASGQVRWSCSQLLIASC